MKKSNQTLILAILLCLLACITCFVIDNNINLKKENKELRINNCKLYQSIKHGN